MAPSRGFNHVHSSSFMSSYMKNPGMRWLHGLQKRAPSAPSAPPSEQQSVARLVDLPTGDSMVPGRMSYTPPYHGVSNSWLDVDVDTTPFEFPELYSMFSDTMTPVSEPRRPIAIKREPARLGRTFQLSRAHSLPTTRTKRKSGEAGEDWKKAWKTPRTSTSPSVSGARIKSRDAPDFLEDYLDDKLGVLVEESRNSCCFEIGSQFGPKGQTWYELWSSPRDEVHSLPSAFFPPDFFEEQEAPSLFTDDQRYDFDEMKKHDSFMLGFDDEYLIDYTTPQGLPDIHAPRRSPKLQHDLNTTKMRKSFVCAACEHVAATEKALEDHADFEDHRAFRCTKEPGCTHSCHRRALLDRHIAYHKAPKSYECLYCDEHRDSDAFKRLDALDQHMKRKHFKQWEEQLIKHCPHSDCEYAKSGFRFTSRVQYRSHMANEHGEGKSDCPFGKDGLCKRVGKDGFKRKRDLEEHVKKVHGQTSKGTSRERDVEDDVLPVYNFA